jgi:hypothetical protein
MTRLSAVTPDIHQLAAALFADCQLVEQQIVGQSHPALCEWWGRRNAFRHAFTTASLLRAASSRGPRPLDVINLSGLSCGHQDFAICGYMRRHDVALRWRAIEHPDSPHLRHPLFRQLVEENRIELVLLDHTHADAADAMARLSASADVVLFTEIAEHLEHRQLLKALDLARSALAPDGYVILTTPNFDQWRFRLRHLLGQELDHWGDGHANMDAGIFGHITYHGVPRLRRLLADSGLAVTGARTFDFPYPDPTAGAASRMMYATAYRCSKAAIRIGEKAWRLPRLQAATKTLGEMIYVEAKAADRQPVPFAL